MTEGIKLPSLPGRGYQWWKEISPEDRKHYMFPRFVAKRSNNQIVDEFGLGQHPGVVAGMRNKWNQSLDPDRFKRNEKGRLQVDPSQKRTPKERRQNAGKRAVRKKVYFDQGAVQSERLKTAKVEPRVQPEPVEDTARNGYRRHYGPPPFMSAKERRERGIVDREFSPSMPTAQDGLDADTSQFLQKHLYEGVPLKEPA